MPLTNEFISTQKKRLEIEKERLEDQIKRLKKYPDYGDIGEDMIQEVEDYETNISIDEQIELLLGKVNAALQAIDQGTYGKCKKCDQMIDEERLEIMPYADFCVKCENEA